MDHLGVVVELNPSPGPGPTPRFSLDIHSLQDQQQIFPTSDVGQKTNLPLKSRVFAVLTP